MKVNLKPLACVLIALLPISLIIALSSKTMPYDIKNFVIIYGVLSCMAGVIILSAGGEIVVNSKKLIKAFWISVIILSAAAIWILISPSLELYFGINMPFIAIDNEQFNCFGFDIPNDKQVGFMMLTGLLLMLPGRTLHLSILKLRKRKRRSSKHSEVDNEFAFNQKKN